MSSAEAVTLTRLVTDLRAAPNDAKRQQLERLRAFACSLPDVCEARQACLDAFDRHVRGVELTRQASESLDASALQQSAHLLLEANIAIEEGHQRMAACDERMARLGARTGR